MPTNAAALAHPPLRTRESTAQATPVQFKPDGPAPPPPPQAGTNHPVAVPAQPQDTARAVLDRAYPAMARQAGLSPAATQEFVRRAPALDGGALHGPSADPKQTGPARTVAEATSQGATTVAPTAAQSGLLQLLQARDAGAADGVPNGAAAGLPFTRGSAPGAPGNGAVTPQVAAELLRNITEGKPPFRPELGQVGPVSWFVTGGTPYTSTGAEKSVVLPVEVTNPTGKPPLTFNETRMLEIYNGKMADARATVEQQIRAKTGRTNGEPLNSDMRKELVKSSERLAQREMWAEMGREVAASESGIGKVELKGSIFSKSGDGEFTMTSRADAVRIKGGTPELLKIIQEHGAPAEPGVLEAAQKLATSEKWGGRVQGAFRVGGKVLIVVGIAADAYKIYTATDKAKAVTEVVGGWAGATALGGAFAAAFTPADAAGPLAWAAHGIGTIVAGGIGYWAGSNATRIVYELAVEGQPLTVGGH